MPALEHADGPVLVTGAHGFVGSWLTERLLGDGAQVVVLRRDLEPDSRLVTEGLVERCTVVQADISDYDEIARVLNEHEVATVFHLAAQTLVGTANRSPLSTFESNIRGTYVLLEACRAMAVLSGPVKRVVVASSDKAYGEHDALPYREDYALLARYPYDVSKACADMLARSYAATYGLPVAVARLANVYGGGDLNFSRLIPDSARALAKGDRPVIRSDGSPRRDLLYAADAVDAYLAIAASLEDPASHGRAWNAGSGETHSVREIVDRLISVSGHDVDPKIEGSGVPHGEIAEQQLDAGALRTELGWTPRHSLDDGLAETYSWYVEHENG